MASFGQRVDAASMATTMQAKLEHSNAGSDYSSRDGYGYRPNPQLTRPPDTRSKQHKPTPSPLQVSPMTVELQPNRDATDSSAPLTTRAGQTSSSAPRSPRSISTDDLNQPKSPVDRLDELLATEALAANEETNSSGQRGESKSNTASTWRAHSYGQLRNVSSPFPPNPNGPSPPHSPTTTTSSRLTGSTVRPSPKPIPRTSSIDSAISTISTATSISYKSSQDSSVSNPADIALLINTAGSPEAVIRHLLKEKQHSASQNAQLWRLVDKQRALLLGLNQDLENALKDKERYRKRLKDQATRAQPVLNGAEPSDPRPASQSPPPGELNNELARAGNASPATNRHGGLAAGSLAEREPHPNQRPNANGSAKGDQISLRQVSTAINRSPTTDLDDTDKFLNHGSAPNTANPIRNVAPLDTVFSKSSDSTSQTSSPVVSPTSFTAKRSQPNLKKAAPGSPPANAGSGPSGSGHELFMPSRKPPPAPLDLRPPGRGIANPASYGSEERSGSDYEDSPESEEIPPTFERGRKKTREEDDEEREAAALKELQDRSRSKKSKGSKTPSEVKAGETHLPMQSQPTPIPPAIKALAPQRNWEGGSNFLSASTSLASVLTPSSNQPASNIKGTVLSMQPLSPGLPMSPRPGDRPINSPMPRLPRDGITKSIASPLLAPPNGHVGLPLSPRAPRQAIPLPPHTPATLVPSNSSSAPFSDDMSDVLRSSEYSSTQPSGGSKRELDEEQGTLASSIKDPLGPGKVYKGLASDAYPDLLIPPNALPSIIIKVTSSRLKPSRNSYLVPKGLEGEPVFTLGVSARSNLQELWQVEKSLMSLPHLDHHLKQLCTIGAKLPDRSLFSGQAPYKIDARRVALEKYFETLLDTPMDEEAALILCQYLSTQVIEDETDGNVSASGSPVTLDSEGRLTKEGYLTKRGKNFGGWKARFFILDDPILKYFESPGGSLLGTIKLNNAKIGKPSPHHSSNSPSGGGEEADNQYRHAFLILEPKRKDSNSHIRHVLCAESDAERDAWVDALLCYVDGHPEVGRPKKPSISSNDSGSSKAVAQLKKPYLKHDGSADNSPDSETFEGLQAVSYEATVAAHPPAVHMTPDQSLAESPPPMDTALQNSTGAQKAQSSKVISGPSNGVKIQDVGAWGNKPLALPQAKEREHKKRSIWGFRDKHSSDYGVSHSNESSLSLTQQQYYERIANVRPVFGMQLAEAVENCPPRGTSVCLPAVVYRCLEYLEARSASSEEGIFRLSGSSVVIKGLRDRFNMEGDFDFLADEQYHDVHAVASLLKLYLRELPASVLTRDLHLDFIQVLC